MRIEAAAPGICLPPLAQSMPATASEGPRMTPTVGSDHHVRSFIAQQGRAIDDDDDAVWRRKKRWIRGYGAHR